MDGEAARQRAAHFNSAERARAYVTIIWPASSRPTIWTETALEFQGDLRGVLDFSSVESRNRHAEQPDGLAQREQHSQKFNGS
jgi:hypothetical protein